MQEYLRKIISSEEKGLFICQLPTGYGKSYCVSKVISELAKDKNNKRKIIYLTTLKKNLPDDVIRKFMDHDENSYDHNVIRIYSNVDMVRDNINKVNIPDEYRSAGYNNLISEIYRVEKAESDHIYDAKYVEELRNRVSEAERDFRHEIGNMLKKKFGTKSKMLNAIHSDKNLRWIGNLYPSVFTDERKVLLMTVSKFLSRNSTIVEPSYDFLSAEMIKDAVIFIDEYDASKAWIMKHLTEKALSAESEYITLFRQLHRNMVRTFFSDDLKKSLSISEKSGHKWFDDIVNKGNDIVQTFCLDLSYKTEDSSVDKRQNFLFHDGSFHTVFDNDKHYIRAHKNDTANRISIFLEDKKTFYKNRKSTDIQIYRLVREIHSYLTYFAKCLYSWGDAYCRIVNSGRETQRDKMTLEMAVNTILSRLSISGSQKELILSEKCHMNSLKNKKSRYSEFDYYSKGMEIFELEDSDEHYETTNIKYIRMSDTPEKIIRFLAENATVFAVSATAEVSTVIGNYNHSYLRSKLGALYHPMDKQLYERVKAETNRIWQPYKGGYVKVHAEMLKSYNGTADAEKICREILDSEQLAEDAARLINICTSNKNEIERYCNLLRVMCRFWIHDDIRSFLYLGMALPKKNNSSMDKDLLHKLFEIAAEDTCAEYDKEALFVLSGNSFDSDKEILLAELEKGKKRFVMSSYATIEAGQNLQYNVPAGITTIELVPNLNDGDKRHFTKDFDALYLGDITHVLVNTYSEGAITGTDMITMLAHSADLYNIGEINYSKKNEIIKQAFKAYSGKKHNIGNDLYHCRDVKIKKTKDVIQAVGRMNRTFMKNPDIYLYIDEKLLSELDVSEMKKSILSPEMESILKLRTQLGKPTSDTENRILNIAEKISTEGKWEIRSTLSRNWTEESIIFWQELREIVLRYPTADENELDLSELIREYYITSGEKQARYFYSQYSDFTDVTIDFGNDSTAFRNSGRAKQKSITGEVTVSEMSEKESGLEAILRYNGMRDMFIQNGYAVGFEEKMYMMSPVLFHNIYKGALGEVAGRFILEKERGIHLRNITDAEKFEFFDYEMSEGVYVDFKNWKYSYIQDKDELRNEIIRKLDHIGGRRVYIINVVKNGDFICSETEDSRIIEIPALIDENGKIICGALDKLKKEDYE